MFKLDAIVHSANTAIEKPAFNALDRLTTVQHCIAGKYPHIDLATGHAKLLIGLANEDSSRILWGTDKSRAEIESAASHLQASGHDARVHVKHTSEIPPASDWCGPEPFSLSATGLGGANLAEILLRNRPQLATCTQMVLQPNRDEARVRAALPRLGFSIVRERFAIERGYLYLVIVCERLRAGLPPLSRREIVHGRWRGAQPQLDELRAYIGWNHRSLTRKLRGELAGGNWLRAEAAFRALRSFEALECQFFDS